MGFRLRELAYVWRKCRLLRISLCGLVFRHLWHRLSGLDVWTGPAVTIIGKRNLVTNARLKVGLMETGFVHHTDRAVLRLDGALIINGNFDVCQGVRIVVGDGARMVVGNSFVNANTLISVSRSLTIGDGCAIGWNCQIVDDDLHEVRSAGLPIRPTGAPIHIGNRVWICSNVIILKGVEIADGCVIASGTVVTKPFLTPGCMIAGNPARIVRENITWTLKPNVAAATAPVHVQVSDLSTKPMGF